MCGRSGVFLWFLCIVIQPSWTITRDAIIVTTFLCIHRTRIQIRLLRSAEPPMMLLPFRDGGVKGISWPRYAMWYVIYRFVSWMDDNLCHRLSVIYIGSYCQLRSLFLANLVAWSSDREKSKYPTLYTRCACLNWFLVLRNRQVDWTGHTKTLTSLSHLTSTSGGCFWSSLRPFLIEVCLPIASLGFKTNTTWY